MKTIKFLISAIILSVVFTSCQKEPDPCNCGTIIAVSDNIYHNVFEPGVYPSSNPTTISDGVDPNDPSRFWLKVTIKNESNGNIQDFYIIGFQFQKQHESFDNQLADLATYYDTTYNQWSVNEKLTIGKRFCVFNKWSANNYFEVSNEPIFW